MKTLLRSVVVGASALAFAPIQPAPASVPADIPAVMKMSSSALKDGSAFKDAQATVGSDNGSRYTDRPFAKANDGRMIAGIYESEVSDTFYESYPADEFMYFISGQVILTDVRGTIKVGPDEAVFVPKGWKGRWRSTAYRKYYVYSADSSTAK